MKNMASSTVSNQEVRAALDAADHYKRTSSHSEIARACIRLGKRPTIRKGVLGFWKEQGNEAKEKDVFTLSSSEKIAIYDMLACVHYEFAQKATASADKVTAHV